MDPQGNLWCSTRGEVRVDAEPPRRVYLRSVFSLVRLVSRRLKGSRIPVPNLAYRRNPLVLSCGQQSSFMRTLLKFYWLLVSLCHICLRGNCAACTDRGHKECSGAAHACQGLLSWVQAEVVVVSIHWAVIGHTGAAIAWCS